MGPLPLKFSPTWTSELGFSTTVSQAWQKFYQGSPSLILEKKLKNVKRELKAWLEMRNQILGQEKISLIKSLKEIQEKME